jgi:hypothetical protein
MSLIVVVLRHRSGWIRDKSKERRKKKPRHADAFSSPPQLTANYRQLAGFLFSAQNKQFSDKVFPSRLMHRSKPRAD